VNQRKRKARTVKPNNVNKIWLMVRRWFSDVFRKMISSEEYKQRGTGKVKETYADDEIVLFV
jgi:hypothetical protein